MPSLSGKSWYQKAAREGAFIRQRHHSSKELGVVQRDMQRQIQQIIKKLEALPKEIQSKATKKALRPGANLLRDAARQNVNVDTGVLKRSIKTFSLRRSKMSLFVGPKVKKKFLSVSNTGEGKRGAATEGDAWYAHFVEFGTRNMSGKGYMRRAYHSKKDEALQKIKEGVEKVVDNWVKKNKV